MMVKVFCPQAGSLVWANPRGGKNKGSDPVCTKCGTPHPPAPKQ